MDDTYDEDFEENETPSIYNLIMTLEAIAAGTLMECALGITHDTDTKKMRQYILKTLSNTDIDSSQLSALSTVVHDISDEQRASPQLQKVVNQINYQHYSGAQK